MAFLAVLSGIGFILAFPVFNLWWLAYLSLVPVFYSVVRTTPSKAFLYSFLFGLVYISGVIYWLFIYSIEGAVATILFATLVVTFLIYSFRYSHQNFPHLKFILYPSLFTFVFFIFSHGVIAFTGLDPSYSQVANLAIIQIADIFGCWGLTFLICLINMLILEIILIKNNKKRIFLCGIIFTIFISVYTYGRIRLASPFKEKTMRVSLIQPNQPVNFDWSRKEVLKEVDKIISLTYATGKFHPDLVVYPEAAVPYYFGQEYDEQTERIKKAASDLDTYILFGTLDSRSTHFGLYPLNSVFLIDNQGNLLNKYAKLMLVPFGEWVPYQDRFPVLEILRLGRGKLFLPGKQGCTIFKHPKAKLSTLICFESMLPWLAQKFVKAGAETIVIVTNDAGFGKSSEPYQHLATARMRAVENRIGIGVAANSGISAIIDPYGRISTQSKLFVTTMIEGEIFLKTQGSIYAQYGDYFPLTCGIIIFAWTCNIISKRQKKRL